MVKVAEVGHSFEAQGVEEVRHLLEVKLQGE